MKTHPSKQSHFDFASLDGGSHVSGSLSVDGASKRSAGAKDFLDSSLEGDGKRLLVISHGLCDFEDIVELYVSIVLNVLRLLSISGWLLQGLDDQRSGRWKNRNGGLSVGYGNLDLNFNSLPLGGGFLDIFSDLLWWDTEWGALWCKGSGCSNLTTNNFHVN